ncbi:MAG: redoxin domain-containing protein [Myxococcota bacterium]
MRLEAGIAVPEFSIVDLDGAQITATSYRGKRLWLVLSRFVACPFCSLRLRRVVERYDAIEAAGVEVLAVFPSKERRVRQFAAQLEPRFRIAADPEQKLFAQFGSETSWTGEMRTAINIPKVLTALVRTRMNPLAIDDKVHRMPSEYLVSPEGVIDKVHYGAEMDDGMAVDSVLEWASSTPADAHGQPA